jgi:hypothetical protein
VRGISRFAALTLLGATFVLTAPGIALGQGYRVDDAGGPLTLTEDLAAASAAWREAGRDLDLDLEQRSDAVDGFEFGDRSLMGPDLVSVTLTPREPEGLRVLLNPDLHGDYPTALLHELGLLLGLPVSGSGVMDPSLAGAAPATPTAEDVAALAALQARVPGDLDGDGMVGLADLALLGRTYGSRGVNLEADLTGDGVVDAADVELLRAEYRFVTPAPGQGGGLTPVAPGSADEEADRDAEDTDEEDTDADDNGGAEDDSEPGDTTRPD